MDSCFVLLVTHKHCEQKYVTPAQEPTRINCKVTRSLYQVPYFEPTCYQKHVLPQYVFRGERRQWHDCWLKKPNINVAGQGQPNQCSSLYLQTGDHDWKRISPSINEKNVSLRHSCSLHETSFVAGPSPLQSFPLLAGGGLVQVLVSVCVPPPHVTLHSDGSDQSV